MGRFSAIVLGLIVVVAAFTVGRLSAQDALPSCVMCQATHIPASEIAAYEAIGREASLTDQQVRSLDIGKSNVQVAVAHRGRLTEPGARTVAEHDLVTEVYIVLSGSGTNLTSPDLVDAARRPADNRAVQFLNGPGQNAASMLGAETHELQAGDVFVIPAGTGHQFTRIDDHISYLMIRVDPDKVVPLMDAADSADYLRDAAR
jgi:mannose-6-phosphate isomerase-like protein (cupin superfamily)